MDFACGRCRGDGGRLSQHVHGRGRRIGERIHHLEDIGHAAHRHRPDSPPRQSGFLPTRCARRTRRTQDRCPPLAVKVWLAPGARLTCAGRNDDAVELGAGVAAPPSHQNRTRAQERGRVTQLWASTVQPASLQVSDSGSNSSVLARTDDVPATPPTTRTFPEGSWVAVCPACGANSEPVRRQVLAAGS